MKSENVVLSEPTERRRHRSQARPQSQGTGMPGKGTREFIAGAPCVAAVS